MEYDDNNVFARIIRNEIKADKVYEDESVLAFHDMHPDASTHVLVIPKGRYSSYESFVNNASREECANFFHKINEIAALLGLKKGFKLVINSGKFQHVPHLHVHILGGYVSVGLLANQESD